MEGMLYLVATPIGNMGDISLRALEILGSVDYIASEDTRKTGILLKRFDIKKPQIAFHEHNEKKALPRILELLNAGQTIALVSNAGSPSISDPGFTLVRAALQEGVQLSAVPGPAALIMALTLSGLPVHSFTFRGFPPRKHGTRRRFLSVDLDSPHTLIFYESPHRVKAFLEDAMEVLGDRPACLANDLTKKFERIDRGLISELLEILANNPDADKGEYTVVIAGAGLRESEG